MLASSHRFLVLVPCITLIFVLTWLVGPDKARATNTPPEGKVMEYRALHAMIILSFLGFPDAAAAVLDLEIPLKKSDVKDSYDLVVVGSDPEGIAAALSGARNGLSTLLVDTRSHLGGLMTQGWLSSIDMNYGPDGKILNKGVFEEFFTMVGGQSFDVGRAQQVFNLLVNREQRLDILLGVRKIAPVMGTAADGEAHKAVVGITVWGPGSATRSISSRRIIDATQDADLAAAAGVPYSLGMADFGRSGRFMAVTLVFKLANVTDADWRRLRRALNRDGTRESGSTDVSAWGFGEEMYSYVPADKSIGTRGLNLGRQRDGTVLVNALKVYGVNPLDPASRERARRKALAEIPRVVKYINAKIPGLERATLAGAAPELYIRESRHIYGEYRLTIDDVLENRDFDDRVAFGSYPVDIQASGPEPEFSGMVVGTPEQYAIPFRCLVPLEVENLLVVGRSASFDSLAHGSARVIPVGMAAGEAAGAAAALSLRKGKTFRQMSASETDMADLQGKLKQQGMDLEPFGDRYKPDIVNDPRYEAVKFVRRMGLVRAGYDNDYLLDEPMTEACFGNVLSTAARQSGAEVAEMPVSSLREDVLRVADAALLLCRCMGRRMPRDEAYEYLKDAPFWNSYVDANDPEALVNHGAGYMLVKDFLDWAMVERAGSEGLVS